MLFNNGNLNVSRSPSQKKDDDDDDAVSHVTELRFSREDSLKINR